MYLRFNLFKQFKKSSFQFKGEIKLNEIYEEKNTIELLWVTSCFIPSKPCTQTMRWTPSSEPSSSSMLKYGTEDASRGTSLYMNPGSFSCFNSSLAWRKLKQNIIKDTLYKVVYSVCRTKKTICWIYELS